MTKFKMVIGVIIGIILLLTGLATIPVQVQPYDDTRIIVEHTYRTYIAPPCFEQAQITNNIAETTWTRAIELGYEPESTCTEQALESVTKVPLQIFAEKRSWRKSEWHW